MDNLRLLEKFILFRAYLLTFVNSFVSFPDLYDPSRRALFEMGTLIMDGRHFTLSVRVSDRTHHAKLSAASNIFVLYVEVNADDTSYELAVAVTSGGQGKLAVGKEGIFHDVYGRELRARVVHIVENPVCLREEVLAPFKRLSRAYNTWIENITTQAEENLAGTSKSAVTLISKRLKTDSAAAPNAGAGVAGLLTGGGIAVAALGSSAAFITKTLAALSWQAVLGGILAMLLALMLPTAWLAYSRLRHRDLSAMLEGAGWAINARMWLTWSQAAKFTFQPTHGTGLRRLRFCLRRWFSY